MKKYLTLAVLTMGLSAGCATTQEYNKAQSMSFGDDGRHSIYAARSAQHLPQRTFSPGKDVNCLSDLWVSTDTELHDEKAYEELAEDPGKIGYLGFQIQCKGKVKDIMQAKVPNAKLEDQPLWIRAIVYVLPNPELEYSQMGEFADVDGDGQIDQICTTLDNKVGKEEDCFDPEETDPDKVFNFKTELKTIYNRIGLGHLLLTEEEKKKAAEDDPLSPANYKGPDMLY